LARVGLGELVEHQPQRHAAGGLAGGRGHGCLKPLPITYCSIEIWRLDAGLAVFATWKRARTASVSFLKSGPWNSLPTKLPPGASTAVAPSSARANRASLRG